MSHPAKSGNLANKYRTVGTQTGVADANPHRLIQMLMEGALEKIAKAKGFIAHGDVPAKGEHIGWAISIIDGLRMSLDKEQGGALAQNLDDLYEYMERQLFKANLHNDIGLLDEVSSLLNEIKSGWDAIPDESKNLTEDKRAMGDRVLSAGV